MTVRIDRLTQDVFPLADDTATEQGDEATPAPPTESAWAVLRRVERDAKRTRAEGYDD